MKNKKEISLEKATQIMESKRNQFWSDVQDIQKKLEKRDIKHKVKLPDYCIHNMNTSTKQ
jgi:predicted DNA-binding protein (UPF0251 family)